MSLKTRQLNRINKVEQLRKKYSDAVLKAMRRNSKIRRRLGRRRRLTSYPLPRFSKHR